MAYHGYFRLQVSASLTGPQLLQVRDAIRGMGRQSDPQPAYVTQVRRSLDNRQVIGEIFLTDVITRAQVKTAVANELGVSEETVEANIVAFEVFTGSDWEQRRQACASYISANLNEWE